MGSAGSVKTLIHGMIYHFYPYLNASLIHWIIGSKQRLSLLLLALLPLQQQLMLLLLPLLQLLQTLQLLLSQLQQELLLLLLLLLLRASSAKPQHAPSWMNFVLILTYPIVVQNAQVCAGFYVPFRLAICNIIYSITRSRI
jgi:hypothetical protein